jgi:hypothetical protein
VDRGGIPRTYRYAHDKPNAICSATPLRERDLLRKEQQRHQATRDLLQAEERSHVSTKGQLTKARNRAKAGLCPCCNRHFTNVERHVKSKHPDFLGAAHE